MEDSEKLTAAVVGGPFRDKNDPRRNLKGRPRTGLAVAEIIRSYLEDTDPGRKVPRIEALAAKLYDMQMDGSVAAGRALLEWGVPKPPQRIEMVDDNLQEWVGAFDCV